MLSRRALAALIVLGFATAGCAGPLRQKQVTQQFAAQFDCSSAVVTPSPGGYRAEGCNRLAFYHCPPLAYANAPLIALAKDSCFLEYSRPLSTEESAGVAQRLQARQALAQELMAKADGARLLSSADIEGGRVQLLAIEADRPEHLLMKLHMHRAFADQCAAAALYHDGFPVDVLVARRLTQHDAELIVDAAALRALDDSMRFGGEVCGRAIQLDERARHALGRFEL